MSFVRNFPIARKFSYAFGIISVLCIGLAVYSFFTMRSITAMVSAVRSDDLPSIVDVATIRFSANSVRRAELALLLCSTPDCTTHYREVRQQSLDDYRAAAKSYEPLISSPEEREVYQEFSSIFTRYTEATDRAMAEIAAGQPDQARQVLLDPAQIKGHADAMSTVNKDLQYNVKEAQELTDDVTAASSRTNWITVIMTLAIVLASIVIGFQLNRFVTPRIRNVMKMAEKLEQKDMTASVRVDSNG